MDANLGKPNSEDVTSSLNVYNLVRQRVEQGLAKFVAISGNKYTVENAKSKGIPVMINTDFEIWEFLK